MKINIEKQETTTTLNLHIKQGQSTCIIVNIRLILIENTVKEY